VVINTYHTFVVLLVSCAVVTVNELKGNTVKIRNCPAAVSFLTIVHSLCHFSPSGRMGRQGNMGSKSEHLPKHYIYSWLSGIEAWM
jgi:DMSO/TMAO reductase YedYZ heme-binding membrane subunit